MSGLKPVEAAQREFTCARCGAQSGEPCMDINGLPKSTAHNARFAAATAAGRLPLSDGEAFGDAPPPWPTIGGQA